MTDLRGLYLGLRLALSSSPPSVILHNNFNIFCHWASLHSALQHLVVFWQHHLTSTPFPSWKKHPFRSPSFLLLILFSSAINPPFHHNYAPPLLLTSPSTSHPWGRLSVASKDFQKSSRIENHFHTFSLYLVIKNCLVLLPPLCLQESGP